VVRAPTRPPLERISTGNHCRITLSRTSSAYDNGPSFDNHWRAVPGWSGVTGPTKTQGEEQLALVVFNGTVMRGEPAHHNLKGAQFLEVVRTAPAYRLFSIRDEYPAMTRTGEGGAAIEAELYDVPDDVWPRIRDKEPPGLYRGAVELEDGRQVEGMLGEPGLLSGPGARDITTFGGWRRFLASPAPKQTGPERR
jgi:gamma-glutamylcyclotransferase (GGCT)/AIG2-like uncharacterized protein YtfP